MESVDRRKRQQEMFYGKNDSISWRLQAGKRAGDLCRKNEEKYLNYSKVYFAIMQHIDLLSFVEREIICS